MSPEKRPIGIFDSGVGGLSVWRAIRRLLPHEDLTYIADHAYFPYGDKPADEVLRRAEHLSGRLIEMGAKLVVVACNTASVETLQDLRRVYPGVAFVGVVPVVKTLARVTKSGSVAVLCTSATARSDYTRQLVADFAGGTRVCIVDCSGLESLVEAGLFNTPELSQRLDAILAPVLQSGADAIGLSCTHYALLRRQMRSRLPAHVRIYDPARPVARRVRQLLRESSSLAEGGVPCYRFASTGDTQAFRALVRRIVRLPAGSAQWLEL